MRLQVFAGTSQILPILRFGQLHLAQLQTTIPLLPSQYLDQAPITLANAVKQAKTALPGMQLISVDLPTSETEAISIYGLYGDWSTYGAAYIDRYSGQVLKVEDTRVPKSLGDRIINSFFDLHVGTFWGLPSRILYVLVGLAPLVLFITGVVMWRHRRKGNIAGSRE